MFLTQVENLLQFCGGGLACAPVISFFVIDKFVHRRDLFEERGLWVHTVKEIDVYVVKLQSLEAAL